MKSELTSYVRMIMDILAVYPLVTVYVLPPLFRVLPAWYASSFEEMLPIFLSDVSHIDLDRVLVVPPLVVTAPDLDFDGVHLKPASLQRVLDLLLTTFTDGVFVRPDDHPLSEDISKFKVFKFFFFFFVSFFFLNWGLFFADIYYWPELGSLELRMTCIPETKILYLRQASF